MKNQEIDDKLREAVTHAAPDVLPEVLAGCKEQGEITVELNTARKKKYVGLISAAAVFLLVLGVSFSYLWRQNYGAVDSIVALDVNPSIELKINKEEEVISAEALNGDAGTILDGMDLKGTKLNVAINALIGSMVKNGYLSDLANSVLVSVENEDREKGAALQQRLTAEIDSILQQNMLEGAVLSQTVDDDPELRAISEQYDISLGKAALIQKILSQNSLLTADDLAKRDINELNLLAASSNTALTDVVSTGSPSDKAYIGEDAAKQAAFTDAGVSESDVKKLEISMDIDDGEMVYEIEFIVAGTEYEYDIHAVTGAIVKKDSEKAENSQSSSSGSGGIQTPSDYIGVEAAKAAALKHAGVTADSAEIYKTELSEDDNIPVYEIDFYVGTTEYEYEIHAVTGAVVKYERDDHSSSASSNSGANISQGGDGAYIGIEAAKEAAFSHAGIAAESARELEAELSKEDGTFVYEIAFKVGDLEYEYEIHAVTGAVLKYDMEKDD